MAGESADVVKEKIRQLKQIIPECFSEGILDIERIRDILGHTFEADDEKYGFNWAGRNDTFRNIQTKSRSTLVPDPKLSVNFDNTENIFIEGENLEVLKLLQNHYSKHVKMIYIDPPYNTGKDFIYKDDFHMGIKMYLEHTGQSQNGIKMTTNPETAGRFHSDWISFMYPRLFLAKNLLQEDGLVFISIDDHEVHNLINIMNEIFGDENFLGNIIWNSTKSVTNTALISVAHTHNLIYAKNLEYFIKNRNEFRLPEITEGFSNPDNDPRGPWKADPFQVGGIRPNQQYQIKNPKTGKIYKPNPGCSWKNELKMFIKLLEDDRIVFGTSGKAGPQRKRFLSESIERGRVPKTLWTDVSTTTNATIELRNLLEGNYFDNPKPVDLIKRFVQLGAPHDHDVIMDFFAGSGTTAHAVLDLNREDHVDRRFIVVQILETNKTKTHSNKFPTIAHLCRERIRHVIKINNSNKIQNVGFKVFRLARSHFRSWERYTDKDENKLQKQIRLFKSTLEDGSNPIAVIYECILREGLSLNSKIKVVSHKPNKVYKVTDYTGSFYVTLDESINSKTPELLELGYDDTLICLDTALNDSQKVNISIGCKLKTM